MTSRLRIALTIARRTSVRSIGRSALVVALVALPVAGLAALQLVEQSTESTPAEVAHATLGKTQARLRMVDAPNPQLVQSPTDSTLWGYVGPDAEQNQGGGDPLDPATILPPGTRMLPVLQTTVTATTATGVATFPVIEGTTWDPSLAGHFDLVRGRGPENDSEIAVTASALPHLGTRLGGTVQLRTPVSKNVTVVGLIDDQDQQDSTETLFGLPGAYGSTENDPAQLTRTDFYLPDTVLDWAAVQKLNAQGAVVLSRAVLLGPPPEPSPYSSTPDSFLSSAVILAVVGGGFAIFEAALLAGAAFTVTARQQQRSLATIASVGATRSTLFRIVSANGLVLGAIGGVVGVGLGIGGGAVFMLATADGNATRYWGFHLSWVAMLTIAVFAIAVGWLAAIVPAASASRIDTVAALRGSRRTAPGRRRRPVFGLVVLLLGVALALGGGLLRAAQVAILTASPEQSVPLSWLPLPLLVAGPILALVGLMLCSALLLRWLAPLLSHVGIGARLAARDAARNPGRAVPALAAIMTTVFVAVFVMGMIASTDASSALNYQYSAPLGDVSVTLTSIDEDQQPVFAPASATEKALKDSLEVSRVSAIRGVPEWIDPAAAPSSGIEKLVPAPYIPPQNLCPNDERSPEYTPAVQDSNTGASAALIHDRRCQDSFPSAIGGGSTHLSVGSVADLALVLGHEPSPAATKTLANGGAVALYPAYVAKGSLAIGWWTAAQWQKGGNALTLKGADHTARLDAVVDEPNRPLPFGLFVSPSTADRLGLDYRNLTVLAVPATTPTQGQLDSLNSAMLRLGGPTAHLETGPGSTSTVASWGLLALAALVAIAAAAVAIGLARVDGRQDDATVASVGGGRTVRRSFAFWQTLMLAGTGAVLGAGVGLLPIYAIMTSQPTTVFAPPWLQVVTIAIALPLVIACGSWLITSRSPTMARRVTIA